MAFTCWSVWCYVSVKGVRLRRTVLFAELPNRRAQSRRNWLGAASGVESLLLHCKLITSSSRPGTLRSVFNGFVQTLGPFACKLCHLIRGRAAF